MRVLVVLFVTVMGTLMAAGENSEDRVDPVQLPFAVGKIWRIPGGALVEDAPEYLAGYPGYVVPRGSSEEPGRSYSLTLESDSVVFLLVHDRGDFDLAPPWRRIAGSASWTPGAPVGEQTDRIYRAEFPAGEVVVPPHEGFVSAFGVPHLAVVVPADQAAGFPAEASADWVPPPPTELWIEAEDFGVTGEWAASREGGVGILKGRTEESPFTKEVGSAATQVEIPAPGRYRLWVRARDHHSNPGARSFHLEIDGIRSERKFGTHGASGWGWEDGGIFELTGEAATIRAIDTSRFFVRFDKLVLSADPDFVPGGVGLPSNVTHLPPTIEPRRERDNSELPAAVESATAGEIVARIAGLGLSVDFESRQVDGRERILPSFVDTKTGERLGGPGTSFFVFLQATKQNATYVPAQGHWPMFQTVGEITVGDESYEGPIFSTDPFACYPVRVFFYPERLVSSAPDKVVLETVDPLFRATITYSLENGRVKTTVETVPAQAGATTVGAFVFDAIDQADCSYFLLPYYFQARRFPAAPLLMPTSVATMPLVLVESEAAGRPLSRGVAANLADGEFEWLTYNRSFAAFALYNHAGKVQPGIFAPVPATDAAMAEAGQPLRLSFYPFASAEPWNTAAFQAAEDYLHLSEVRTNLGTSLTEAALNMQDLLMHDEATGWDVDNHGFIQIEDENIVTQASPLALAQLYALTGDDAVYDQRMLPTAAFLFSRHHAHFATDPVNFGTLYGKSDVSFQGPVRLYGASVQAGFDHMFRGRTDIFRHDAFLPDGEPRHSIGSNATPVWSEQLWGYKLSGRPELLEQAVAGCLAAAEATVFTAREDPRDYESFVKLDIPPYFWGMIDLYEETGNERILEAARLGADTLLTLVYLHPYPFAPNYDVQRQTLLDEAQNVIAWWRLDHRFRLGFDTSLADPKEAHPKLVPIADYLENPENILEGTVPAWSVSPVGITIEQPVTLAAAAVGRPDIDGLINPIRNSGEAAYLLRLFGHTGEKRYQTYARNMVLGQFSNYPGYYINYLSATERAPDYPYKGPDLSSIYFHHIPVHYAFTTDWLFTAAENRSDDQVVFPGVLQQGYVWFTNRLRGHAPGKFYEHENAWPVLRRGLVSVDNPMLNYVMAASPDGLHIFLMNEASEEVESTLVLDETGLILPSEPAVKVDAGGSLSREKPPTGWFGNLLAAIGGKPDDGNTTLTDGKVSVSIPARGNLALTFPGVQLKSPPWAQEPAGRPTGEARSWVREKDEAIGEWVQAALFTHPTKSLYDAFVNLGIQRAGTAVLHYSLDGKTWLQTPPKTFPFDFFVRSEEVNAPFEFFVEWTPDGADSPARSKTQRLTTGF